MNNQYLLYHDIGKIFSLYSSNRDKAINKYHKEIAEINLQMEKDKAFTNSINALNTEVLEERQRAMKYCMRVLDISIEKGDTEIAAIATHMIKDEYSRDILKHNIF